MVETGLLDWAGVADRMSAAPARDRPASSTTAAELGVGAPANLVLVDPARPARRRPGADGDGRAATRRSPGGSCPAGWSPRSYRGTPTVLDGALAEPAPDVRPDRMEVTA